MTAPRDAKRRSAMPVAAARLLAASWLLASGAGCAVNQRAPATPPPHAVSRAPDAGRIAAFEFVSPPRLLAPAAFTVSLSGAGRRAPARVSVSFTMPDMAMPDNVIVPAQIKPGLYSGTTMLTMSGRWIATVIVIDPGKLPVRKEFPFRVS